MGAAHLLRKSAADKAPKRDLPDDLAPPGLAPAPSAQVLLEEDSLDVDHYLNTASVGLGLAIAGRLAFPPLGLLSLPVLGYVTLPTFQDAYSRIKNRTPHISMLDVCAAFTGIAANAYILSGMANVLYFGAIKLKRKTRATTHEILAGAVTTSAPTVWLLQEEVETSVPLAAIARGDLIVVHASELVLADGVIVGGTATVDQQSLTGETQPSEKAIGDQVMASSTVLSGRITIRVESAGAETVASNIQSILDSVSGFASHLETRTEQLSNASVMPTIGLAGVSLLAGGPLAAGAVLSSNFAETMRVTSPCSLLNYLNIAARRGLLIKDGQAIETLNKVDTVVFDKTGTLTEHQPRVGSIHPCAGFSESDVLFYTAAAEYRQRHPIARAILDEAERRAIKLPTIDNAHYSVGFGTRVTLNDIQVRVGSRRFMLQEQIRIPAMWEELEHPAGEQGFSLVYTALNQELCGVIELRPNLRREAGEVVRSLQKRGITVRILSGDHPGAVKYAAEALGVSEYFAEVLPADKARLVKQWQRQGRTVCFVGDGLNDAIALRSADVSISLQNASNAAMDSAQIILMNKDLTQLLYSLEVAQRFASSQSMHVAASAIPSAMALSGAMLFGLTISGTLWFYLVSIAAGFAVSVYPLLGEQSRGPATPPPGTLPSDPVLV